MYYLLSYEEVCKRLGVNYKRGLREDEVKRRQEKDGKNKLDEKKKDNIIIKFLKQFNDFMIIILILASIISAIVAKLQGTGDYLDSIIIIAIVIFNAIMGLVQESKAEKSLEALKKMSAPKAIVLRNGRKKIIDAEDTVVGDIIFLESGCYVPADCRIIESFNLKIEESTLTGETVPVDKQSQKITKQNIQTGDINNMAFATTVVVNGHATAVVTDIGMNTKVGHIAKLIIEDEAPKTPIQTKLEQVGKVLGIVCLVICAVIFLIGILKNISPIEMFMTSIGLAVAAIPEGLPAIVTIVLSIGVTKMAKKNAIIRKLPAVETLGSSSVICSDKTGTLTQNKMEVVSVSSPCGKNSVDTILELGTMCTDCNVYGKITGDSTEVAIVEKAQKMGIYKEDLYDKNERINDIPFDSTRKLMSTIHRIDGGYRVITKGAPDELIKRCTKYYDDKDIYFLSDKEIQSINRENNKMAEKALRVIAVAYCDLKQLPKNIDSNNIERNLIFVGLIGMVDPPRKGVKEAINECKRAGIKTVMITGDHIITAKAIAKELGIFGAGDLAITGEELDKISEEKLQENIMKYSVVARVSPEHKVRIVKAFRNVGKVTAMTGDGVNDSPALKNADIGIAMGMSGTDVAKNAADMVLTDDNFVTIVEAVKYR